MAWSVSSTRQWFRIFSLITSRVEGGSVTGIQGMEATHAAKHPMKHGAVLSVPRKELSSPNSAEVGKSHIFLF